jgi:hypothetical protein
MQFLNLAIVVLMCVYHTNAGIYQPGRKYPMKPQYGASTASYGPYQAPYQASQYKTIEYPKYQTTKSVYTTKNQYTQPQTYKSYQSTYQPIPYVVSTAPYSQPSYDSGTIQDVYQNVQYPQYQSNYKKRSIYGIIKQQIHRQPSQYIREYQPQVQQYQPSESYDMNQYSGPSY